MTDATVASFVTLAGMIAGFGYQAWRQQVALTLVSRQRAWDLEDRRLARDALNAKAEQTAAVLVHTTEATAQAALDAALQRSEEIQRTVLEAHQETQRQLTTVAQTAAKAYEVGNHSAEKLAAVNNHLVDLNQRLLVVANREPTALADLAAVTTENKVLALDTNEAVHDVRDEVVKPKP